MVFGFLKRKKRAPSSEAPPKAAARAVARDQTRVREGGKGKIVVRPGTSSPSVPPEVLRQVKLLELRTRGLVNSLFTGEYRSVFKGQGMEFAEVREYQPGDEVRSIDWNVTARMQRPYVKRYIEERELTVMLAVDVSGSERFGTRIRFKSELASELAAVLAMSAIRNNDRVGCIMFTDRIEHVVPPRKGRRHALRLIRDILAFEPVGRGTDIGGGTEYLNKMLTHKAIIFVVSDFIGTNIERPLKLLAQRHDVVAVTVDDPSERLLPDIGLVAVRRSRDRRDARRRHERPGGARAVRVARDGGVRRSAANCFAGSRSMRSRFTRTAGSWIRCFGSFGRASGGFGNEASPRRHRRLARARSRLGRRTRSSRKSRSRPASRPHRTRCASAIRFASPSAFAHRAARRSSSRARRTRRRRCSRSIRWRCARLRTRPPTEQYGDYRVAAWDIGTQPIKLGDVIVRYNGAERHIPLTGTTVFVRSVLPADTAQRVPKPPRALFEFNPFPWWLVALIAAAIIAIGLLIWWWIRRRRKPVVRVVVDPYMRAEAEFARIEALGAARGRRAWAICHAHDRGAARLSVRRATPRRRCRSPAPSCSARCVS